ncbi:MAG: hypothetical protein J6W03_10555 [Bacteroidaceae bacterium]|nr:hypothetical protein [Bacteroidaceae bacterium]
MKRKSIISMLLLSMMYGMFSTSCQDMLSPDSERHAYTVAEDTLYSYWGILKSLQNIAERYVILNECRGDLVDASGYVSDTIGAIINFGEVEDPEDWKDGACAYLKVADYYHVINSCNAYIAMCDTVRTTGTNKLYMMKEYAQVQSIRAWVYMQLLYAYGENRVPFYKEPMLTTDDIDNFMDDKNHAKLTAQLLAEELGPELEKLEAFELNSEYGMPQYNNYGDASSSSSHFVCHSSRCMFPIPIVLGDLYLLSGKYVDAAQHYFNYINTRYCGPIDVDNYYSTGRLDERLDYPIYDYTGSPYGERGQVARSTEMITCIPSNTGKLEGKVMTDVNRLFGFTAEMTTGLHTSISVNNSGDVEQSSDIASMVILTPNYERELIPSKGYEALCDSQKFEIYVGDVSAADFWGNGSPALVELPGVGDARRSWIFNGRGRQWTYLIGDDTYYGKMVSKQNPRAGFITTYPVIYRKSTVWLRYAEALNRAGYPSYAFAVLKTGLCNYPEWFPEAPSSVNLKSRLTNLFSNGFDYPVKDSLYCYRDTSGVLLPEGWDTDNQIHHFDDLISWLEAYFEEEYAEALRQYESILDPDESLPEPSMREVDFESIYYTAADDDAFWNTPATASNVKLVRSHGVACNYLDRREVERALNAPYMDFKQTYLRGLNNRQRIYIKDQGKLLNETTNSLRYPDDNNDEYLTMGIHQRGCGFIRFDEPAGCLSSYNYVNMVQKKIKEATGMELTEEDIYSGKFDDEVQNAVEDLIIDECALELAFEGTRFSDLCRVAMRRGNPDYLAERISKRRTGEVDNKLRSRLQNMTNWFLPLPEE